MAIGVSTSKIKDGRVNKLETKDAAKYMNRSESWLRCARTEEKKTGVLHGPQYVIMDGRVYYYKTAMDVWMKANPGGKSKKKAATVATTATPKQYDGSWWVYALIGALTFGVMWFIKR